MFSFFSLLSHLSADFFFLLLKRQGESKKTSLRCDDDDGEPRKPETRKLDVLRICFCFQVLDDMNC